VQKIVIENINID